MTTLGSPSLNGVLGTEEVGHCAAQKVQICQIFEEPGCGGYLSGQVGWHVCVFTCTRVCSVFHVCENVSVRLSAYFIRMHIYVCVSHLHKNV